MLTIPLDTHSVTPLYEQIYLYIKSQIQLGHLPYQSRLPSTRGLAAHLGVSRNTVDMAYAQLLSEGYLISSPKRGFFVSQISGLASIRTEQGISGPAPAPQEKEYRYNFSPFSVDLTHFPYHTWRQLSKNCLDENNQLFLLGENQGDLPLRNAICTYLHQSRGVNCTPVQLIVGAGVDYLLQLLSSLIPADSLIAMENPTYKRAYHIWNGLGFSTCAVDLDDQGLKIDRLAASGASLTYVTPSHQYPLGIVMPIKRRLELLNWAAEKENRYIIEDDHDSEFRYKGKPIPSLQGIDSKGKVIYIGTFSRAIAPAIRVGYMVLPLPLLRIYQNRYSYYSSTVSRIDQAIITGFMEQGYFERHLNRMRKIYKNKHDICILTLREVFGSNIEIRGENAGLYLVIRLRTSRTEKSIIQEAEQNGIKLYGLYEHFITPPAGYTPTFLMGFANLSEEDIIKGIHALYPVWDNQNKAGPPERKQVN